MAPLYGLAGTSGGRGSPPTASRALRWRELWPTLAGDPLRLPGRRSSGGKGRGIAMATSEQASDASSPLLGARVLLAEDDALVALYLMTTLQTASYVVVGPVSAVAEALTIIDSEPPDAAVLDLRFAAGDTAPVAAALLAGDVPFVVLTDDAGLELEPALAGAPRLLKPVQPDLLLSLVHDLVKGRGNSAPLR